jgi:hypothetical protein
MGRSIEVAGLAVIVALSGVAGYAIELLSPYATTRVVTVLLLLAVIVPFIGTTFWVLRQVEKLSRLHS